MYKREYESFILYDTIISQKTIYYYSNAVSFTHIKEQCNVNGMLLNISYNLKSWYKRCNYT